jgi:phage shock protein E
MSGIMKKHSNSKLNSIAALILTVAFLGGCASGPANTARDLQTSIFRDVATADAKSLIESKSELTIIDVRTLEEYASGHLKNAINVDIRAADFSNKIGSLDKNKEYLVYCRTGKRSASAVETMKGLGFTAVDNLTGGITQWQADGGATVQ